jgi:hypothetical protein
MRELVKMPLFYSYQFFAKIALARSRIGRAAIFRGLKCEGCRRGNNTSNTLLLTKINLTVI